MLLVELSSIGEDGLSHFVGAESTEHRPELAVIVFKGRDGFEFTHEKSVLRESRRDTYPSPRGDGTTHYFEKKDQGVIIQEGPGVIAKAHLFTTGYLRYVQTYCAFIG